MDFGSFRRTGKVTVLQYKPEHPLAKTPSDEEIHEHRFQSLGCGHCQRVYQHDTWVWRCGPCGKKGRTILFGACEDCGGRRAAKQRFVRHYQEAHQQNPPKEVERG